MAFMQGYSSGGQFYTFEVLERMGVFDVILPFILIFTIVYAVLQKTKILGERKNFNVVIALVMGLSVVFPHVMGYYPPERDIVNIINQALPQISLAIVGIIMVLLILGVFGSKWQVWNTPLSGWAVLLAIGIVGLSFASAAGWNIPRWLSFLNNPEIRSVLVVILVFAVIIWFITKEEKEEKSGMSKFVEGLGEGWEDS